jgi:hypothetical protein
MRRLTLSLVMVLAGAAAVIPGAAAAHKGGDVCVAHKPGCLGTIQAAVDAAHVLTSIVIGILTPPPCFNAAVR